MSDMEINGSGLTWQNVYEAVVEMGGRTVKLIRNNVNYKRDDKRNM